MEENYSMNYHSVLPLIATQKKLSINNNTAPLSSRGPLLLDDLKLPVPRGDKEQTPEISIEDIVVSYLYAFNFN